MPEKERKKEEKGGEWIFIPPQKVSDQIITPGHDWWT